MPRETIRAADDYSMDVQVGWAAVGGDVQLGLEVRGTEEVPGRTLLWMLYGELDSQERIGRRAVNSGLAKMPEFAVRPDVPKEELFREVGRKVIEVIEGSSADGLEPAGTVYTDVWAHLDRHGCNRLIRLIRKARDTVFGRDE